MVILHIGLHLAVHLVMHLPLLAGVTTADVGTADLDAIHGGYHQTSGPIGAQNPVSFETASDFTVQRDDGFGRLTLHCIAEGVVTNWTNALGQRPGATLGLNLEQTGPLHGG